MSAFTYDKATKRAKVTVYAGLGLNGRQRQRTKTWVSPNQAQAKREAAEHEATIRAALKKVEDARGTITELVTEWLEHRKAQGDAETTLRRTEAIGARIIKDLGAVDARELTARNIDHWYTTLRSENIGTKLTPRYRSESTIHHYHRVLKAILQQGERWSAVDAVATKKATAPSPPKARLGHVDTATLLRVMAAAPPDLRAAAALAAATGARRGELVGFRWSDIDGNKLTVQRSIFDQRGGGVGEKLPKTDQERTIKLDAQTIAALWAHRADLEARCRELRGELADDGPILANIAALGKRGRVDGTVPRRPHWFTQQWAKHCARHGVKIRLHDLRHWHASYLIEHGVPITAVSKRLGHALVSTTLDIYGHASDDSDDRAAAAVGLALNPGPADSSAP